MPERLHADITRIMSIEAGRPAMRHREAEPMMTTLAAFDADLRHDLATVAERVRRAKLRAG